MKEVEQHNCDGDRWLVYDGDVYDVSEFKHPGGLEAISKNGGKDATDRMNSVEAHGKHSEGVQRYLAKLKIGTLKLEEGQTPKES